MNLLDSLHLPEGEELSAAFTLVSLVSLEVYRAGFGEDKLNLKCSDNKTN